MRTRRIRHIVLAISVAFGAAGALSYVARWLVGRSELGTATFILLAAYLWFLFSIVGLLWVQRLIEPTWHRLSSRAQIGAPLLLGVLGLFATFVLPTSPPRSLPSWHRLEIRATGERNSAAQGSEVWLLDWPAGLTSSDLPAPDQWEARSGDYVSYQNQPNSLVLEGWLYEGDSVFLLKHAWSGIVEIRWDDAAPQLLDLYAAVSERQEVPPPSGALQYDAALHAAVRMSDAVVLAMLLAGIALPIFTRTAGVADNTRDVSRRRIFLYGLPSVLIWSLYLLSFWPGLLSNDSLDQWSQALTGHYSDWHPVFHTLMIWLLTTWSHTPGTVGLAQIVALALTVGWGLCELEYMGISRRVLWLTAFVFALAPANGVMTITLWKDVPFSIASLALSVLILRVVRTKGTALADWRIVAAFGLVAALVALFRHIGPPAAFGTLAAILILYGNRWKSTLTSLVLSLALWFGVRGPLYQILQVSGPTQPGLMWPVLHQIAGHLAAGTPMGPEETHLLDQVIPLTDGWPYFCTIVDPIAFNPAINTQFAIDHLDQLAELAFQLALRNPSVTANQLLCNSMFIGQIGAPEAPYDSYETAAVLFDSNGIPYSQSVDFSLETMNLSPVISPLPELASLINRIVLRSLHPFWQGLFWRPAIYAYLGLFGVLVALRRRRDTRIVLVALPAVITAALLVPLTVGQAFRLVYALLLTGMFLIPLIWIPRAADTSPGVRTDN